MFRRLLALPLVLASLSSPASADDARLDQVIDRFESANRWREHVLVVAHRAGWLEDGRPVRPENSRAALDHAVALGVEMVELDVRASGDGELVVMHDSWLDRTTTCRGEVERFTVAELKRCRLLVEEVGPTEEVVPTLREMLLAARGRVLVNVDNKLGVAAIPAIAALAAELGVERQVVVKENLWDEKRVRLVRETLDGAEPVRFMPVMADDAVQDAGFVESAGQHFAADAVEMIAWRGEGMTADGGALFSPAVRDAAERGDWHLWVNAFSIVNLPGGTLAGGRGDELAVLADLPGEAWGFWAEQGATIIQTDEPEAAIRWLEANGYRAPYAEPSRTAAIAQ